VCIQSADQPVSSPCNVCFFAKADHHAVIKTLNIWKIMTKKKQSTLV